MLDRYAPWSRRKRFGDVDVVASDFGGEWFSFAAGERVSDRRPESHAALAAALAATFGEAPEAPPRPPTEIALAVNANQRPVRAADQHVRMERTTGFEPATLTLARAPLTRLTSHNTL